MQHTDTPGLRIEPASDDSQSDVEYDAKDNVVRIPLSAMDGGRRTKLVMFTCNKCGAFALPRSLDLLSWRGRRVCVCHAFLHRRWLGVCRAM